MKKHALELKRSQTDNVLNFLEITFIKCVVGGLEDDLTVSWLGA